VRHQLGTGILILAVMCAAPVLGAEPDFLQQGLSLLDQGRPAAAAAFFTERLLASPEAADRLPLLGGLLRARACLVHSDSLTIPSAELQAMMAGNPPLLRYLAAERLSSTLQRSAAADSFLVLAEHQRRSSEPIAAWLCLSRAVDCRVELGDSVSLSRAEGEMKALAPLLALPPRPAQEWELLRGNILFKQDELDQARQVYEGVREKAAENGWTVLLSDALNALGAVASKQRRLQDSRDLLHTTLDLSQRLGDPQRECLARANLGYQLTSLRLFPEARAHLERADQLALRWGANRLRGPIQAGLGALREMQGQRRQAVEHFRRAIALGEQQANTLATLGARQRLAYNLSMMGRYSEAREHYQVCLDELDRAGGRFILNWVLGGLAFTNKQLGYLDEAERLFTRARQVNQAMGDGMSAVWCLNSLGEIQALRGEYRQALLTMDQARQDHEYLDDTEGLGQTLGSMADVFLRLGNYHQALEHANQAARLAEKANAQELLRTVAATRAAVHGATGQPDKAEAGLRHVLEVTRQWEDRAAEIWALHDLAEHLLEHGGRVEAAALLDRAWMLLGTETHLRARSAVALLLSRAADNPARGLEWAQRSAQLARQGDLPHRLWPAHFQAGRRLRQLGRIDQAAEALNLALGALEGLRRRAGSQELRRHMLNPATGPYLELVELYAVDRAQPALALAVSERFRSRLLAENLRSALEPRAEFARETGSEAARRGLLARLAFMQSQLQADRLGEGVRDSLRAEVAELEHQLTLLGDRFAGLVGEEAPGNPATVLRENEHLLSYLLGPDRSYLFSVTRDRVRVHLLPARQVIEEKAELYLQLQRHRSPNETRPLPAAVLERAGRNLHDLLLGPVRGEIAPGATLLLALDGALHRVPISRLRDGEQSLLANHPCFVVPSLQTLELLRRRTPGQGTMLAVGCAAGEEADGRGQRMHLFRDRAIPALPHAEAEARRVVAAYGRGRVMVGDQAVESGVLEAIAGRAQEPVRIIHFAAHGHADERDPRRSYVVLNQAEDAAADGLLQWHEIAGLDLQADLVTLAACRSARGVTTAGEGVTGLAEAFLHGGSRCVLAALSDVPDRAAGRILDRFYRELGRGATAAEALRRAQLDASNSSSPDWAGSFVLVGDGQVRAPVARTAWWRWPGLALLATLVFLLALVFRRGRKKNRGSVPSAERSSLNQ
jgi:CHAT domain-containing protein/tetratricopeptide (TPR) repeat protein